jgi:hypothetical protein
VDLRGEIPDFQMRFRKCGSITDNVSDQEQQIHIYKYLSTRRDQVYMSRTKINI